VHATSLNFRDLLALRGSYPVASARPIVPLSDGAGKVEAVGAGVTRVSTGDRVTATTISNWIDGSFDRFDPATAAQSIGFTVDGWLAEEIILPETALVKLPDSVSYESASTFACAGVTAWNAVVETARVGPGDHVLALGTGGVSMFAVQIAKLLGASALVTSSSDAKLERARALGAAAGVNYMTHPEWGQRVRELTGGRGVDLVIETAGTLQQSLKATRYGGTVAVIGMLALLTAGVTPRDAAAGNGDLMAVFRSGATVTPILMGNRRMLTRLVDAYATHQIAPVIDRTFPFDDASSAFDALAAADHVGKLVVTV
jgi:NADPH:quinone reductase-like Zn-dependent oxidoreductase